MHNQSDGVKLLCSSANVDEYDIRMHAQSTLYGGNGRGGGGDAVSERIQCA